MAGSFQLGSSRFRKQASEKGSIIDKGVFYYQTKIEAKESPILHALDRVVMVVLDRPQEGYVLEVENDKVLLPEIILVLTIQEATKNFL